MINRHQMLELKDYRRTVKELFGEAMVKTFPKNTETNKKHLLVRYMEFGDLWHYDKNARFTSIPIPTGRQRMRDWRLDAYMETMCADHASSVLSQWEMSALAHAHFLLQNVIPGSALKGKRDVWQFQCTEIDFLHGCRLAVSAERADEDVGRWCTTLFRMADSDIMMHKVLSGKKKDKFVWPSSHFCCRIFPFPYASKTNSFSVSMQTMARRVYDVFEAIERENDAFDIPLTPHQVTELLEEDMDDGPEFTAFLDNFLLNGGGSDQ